jgi:thiol-disulfide isomerase/thioredoxin
METTEPNPTWDAEAHSKTVDAIEAAVGEVTYRIWGADWCGDCRATLPDFFAALEAAGVPDYEIEVYEVDQEKDAELVEAYDVTLIPTIVVEQGSTGNRTQSDNVVEQERKEGKEGEEDEEGKEIEEGEEDEQAKEDDEIARFEESEDRPAAQFVAERLLDADVMV